MMCEGSESVAAAMALSFRVPMNANFPRGLADTVFRRLLRKRSNSTNLTLRLSMVPCTMPTLFATRQISRTTLNVSTKHTHRPLQNTGHESASTTGPRIWSYTKLPTISDSVHSQRTPKRSSTTAVLLQQATCSSARSAGTFSLSSESTASLQLKGVVTKMPKSTSSYCETRGNCYWRPPRSSSRGISRRRK